MGKKTGISWTHSTFNPWVGCTKVSPGCANCYAETRNRSSGGDSWGPGKPRQRTSPATWARPLAWNRAAAQRGKQHLVFCASQADFLDPEVPVEWLADLQQLIVATPHLTWQLLTKRPELWRERFEAVRDLGGTSGAAVTWLGKIPPRNVWLGVTVEDQKRADERIMALRAIPALVRFVSMEPLLEEVDLRRIKIPEGITDVLNGHYGESIPVMDWIIVGGESGPNARPFNLAWARSIVKQCKEAGVKVWVKQMGDWTVADGNNARGLKMLQLDAKDYGLRDDLVRVRFSTHHGADPAEWPEDLRVQEFPV